MVSNHISELRMQSLFSPPAKPCAEIACDTDYKSQAASVICFAGCFGTVNELTKI